MTLRRRDNLCIAKSERPRVQRPPHNHAFHTFLFQRHKPPDIFQRGDPAGGDDWNFYGAGDFTCLVEVHPFPRAVAANVGVDDARGAILFATLGEFDGVH